MEKGAQKKPYFRKFFSLLLSSKNYYLEFDVYIILFIRLLLNSKICSFIGLFYLFITFIFQVPHSAKLN
jgi:hypothetical protein